ncbi:MAG: hypothetical protein RIR31_1220, partial [Bacteroidota bacterium]
MTAYQNSRRAFIKKTTMAGIALTGIS